MTCLQIIPFSHPQRIRILYVTDASRSILSVCVTIEFYHFVEEMTIHCSSVLFENVRLIIPLEFCIPLQMGGWSISHLQKYRIPMELNDPYLFHQVKVNPTLNLHLRLQNWICFNFGNRYGLFNLPFSNSLESSILTLVHTASVWISPRTYSSIKGVIKRTLRLFFSTVIDS